MKRISLQIAGVDARFEPAISACVQSSQVGGYGAEGVLQTASQTWQDPLILVAKADLWCLDLEMSIHQEDIVNIHLFWGIHTDDVAVSDQEPLGPMPLLDQRGSQGFPEIKTLGGLNDQEPSLPW